MKSRVRFHLAEGRHKGHWQIRRGRSVRYVDPNVASLTMRGCRLVNRPATARKIYCGENKTPCAWIECDRVEVSASPAYSGSTVSYNPRVAPHWVFGGDNADGMTFALLSTRGRHVLA